LYNFVIDDSFGQWGSKVERGVLLEKAKVLVIDDDRPLCKVVAEVLLAKTKEGSNYTFNRRKG